MFQSKVNPLEDEIEKATNENNVGEDWSLIMQICDDAVNYSDGAKFCLKAILKRLHHNVPRVVLSALTILDACVKNCDRRFLLQIASSEFTNEVRKLLTKMHPTAAIELKAMIQRWSLQEFKDDSELCIIPSLYYKLKSEGVEFPSIEKEKKQSKICTDPDAVTTQEEENDIIKALEISLKDASKNQPVDQRSYDSKDKSEAKVATELTKVRVLYDFEAAEDNELTIKAGEIIVVTDNSNSSWWKGSNHRGEGLFPANFATEDLNAPVDLPQEVDPTPVEPQASDSGTSFVGEVIIDEKKIEMCLNWLKETDPSDEEPDPPDMLRLEDEVNQMAPIIEDHIQAIDDRIAKLGNVNLDIVKVLDMFHQFANNWTPEPLHMQIPHTNGPGASSTSGPSQSFPHMGQPMVYYPPSFPSISSYPFPMMQQQQQQPGEQNTENESNQERAENGAASTASQSEASNASQSVSQPSMAASPYLRLNGGFFVPPSLPVISNGQWPGPFPPNQASSNFVNIPYPLPPVGPVPFQVSFPYPWINSGSTPHPATQTNNLQPAPMQQVPTQQVPTQPVSIQQVPTQQVPTQQVPTQQVPTQQVPMQPVSSQSHHSNGNANNAAVPSSQNATSNAAAPPPLPFNAAPAYSNDLNLIDPTASPNVMPQEPSGNPSSNQNPRNGSHAPADGSGL